MIKQFSSKFFDIKNTENAIFKYSLKILFQQFLLFSTCLVFILLTVISYTNGNEAYSLIDLPVHVRLARSLFPVFLTWYIFASLWSIKSGFDFIKSNCNLIGWINIFAFIPFFSIYLLFYFLSKIDKETIKYYKILLFEQSEVLKQKYEWGSWRRNLILALFIVVLPVAFFFFFEDTTETEYAKLYLNNLWFSSFNFFTIQTNAMVLIFTTVLLLFPSLKIFKNNNLQISIAVYIFVVGFAWNTILLPTDISSGATSSMSTYDWISTSWFHIVVPITFVITSLILIFKQPYKTSTPFSNIFKLGLVYPLMYLTFVAIVPFTAGISIYGTYTNPNPLLMNASGSYGNPIYFLLIVGFLLVFLVVISILWFLDNKINSKRILQTT